MNENVNHMLLSVGITLRGSFGTSKQAKYPLFYYLSEQVKAYEKRKNKNNKSNSKKVTYKRIKKCTCNVLKIKILTNGAEAEQKSFRKIPMKTGFK